MSGVPPGARPPAGRQGPGLMPGALVEALDLVLARRAAGALAGERRAAGLGRGTELAQLRPYQVGDDVRRLDAAASARTGVPHVREDVPERAMTTWLVLDVSASMGFGAAQRLKSDVAEGVAIVIGRLATRRGGRVAVVTCGEQRALAPLAGRRALVGLRKVLEEGVATDGHAATAPTLAAALTRAGRLARGPGLVVVVSDFRDDVEEWRRPLSTLAARHDVLAVEVTDPREAELPAVGHLVLVDPETSERVEANTGVAALRERFAAAEAERRAGVARALRRARARHVVAATDGDWLRELGRGLR